MFLEGVSIKEIKLLLKASPSFPCPLVLPTSLQTFQYPLSTHIVLLMLHQSKQKSMPMVHQIIVCVRPRYRWKFSRCVDRRSIIDGTMRVAQRATLSCVAAYSHQARHHEKTTAARMHCGCMAIINHFLTIYCCLPQDATIHLLQNKGCKNLHFEIWQRYQIKGTVSQTIKQWMVAL